MRPASLGLNRDGRATLRSLTLGLVIVMPLCMAAGCVSSPPLPSAAKSTEDYSLECRDFFSSKELAEFLKNLSSLSLIQAPSWATYRFENHALLIVDSAPNVDCVLLWSHGTVLARTSTRDRLGFLTPVFSFFYSSHEISPHGEQMQGLAQVMAELPEALKDQLKSSGHDRTLLIKFNFDTKVLGEFGNRIHDFFASYNIFRLFMVVHEGAHLNIEFPEWFSASRQSYSWPKWDKQPDRAELVRECYHGKNGARQLWSEEWAALLAAFESSYLKASVQRTRTLALKFIAARERRYLMLGDLKIHSSDGSVVDCRTAETIMELEEGALDYIGFETLLQLNLISANQLRAILATSYNEPFYRAGALQLLILKKLPGQDMRAVSTKITRSLRPLGIYTQFRAAFKTN